MKVLSWIGVLVLAGSTWGQKFPQRKHQIEVRKHYGYMLPFRPQIYELIEGPATAWEFSYVRPTDGSETWEQAYRFPKIGWTFLWMDLSNPEEIGHTAALFPNLRIPFNKGRLQSIFQMGLGLGYIEKPFHPKTNFKNLAIGSHINALMQLQFNLEYQLLKKTSITLGTALTHYSNAATRRPNLGFNIWTFSAGIRQGFGPKWEALAPRFARHIERWRPYARISMGTTQATIDDPKNYPVLSVAGGASKRRGEKFSFLGQMEYQLNTSNEAVMLNRELEPTSSAPHRVGVALGGRMHFGLVSLQFEQGAYLYNPSGLRGLLYHRLQATASITSNHHVAIGVKTHFAQAENLEIGYVYVW